MREQEAGLVTAAPGTLLAHLTPQENLQKQGKMRKTELWTKPLTTSFNCEVGPAVTGGSDQMISRGPLQPKIFYHSVIPMTSSF